jgi:hypothetical protein
MRASIQVGKRASSAVAAGEAHPYLIRIPLPSVEAKPLTEALDPCPHCGSHGFNAHQREWRRIKDPHYRRVLVIRYVCKRCGRARRSYPVGVSASRQSEALKQLSVLLYWVGLSYLGVRAALAELGCALACTSIRRNVKEARGSGDLPPVSARLHLAPVGGGILRGRDGMVALRLEQTAPGCRVLVAEIVPGPNAAHIRWRLQAGAGWLARSN